ncbi:MAG: methyl-accepting chemotaxis protein [Deltaproteobacteria bacterium]|nr:methyl-accepting chemotaxis protein [Deltaproteobacteria bacterium]
MSTSKKSFKRKRFFNFSIKKRLQFRMLVKIWSIIFITLLLTGIIFYFYSDINIGKSYRLFHVKADNFLDFLFPVLLIGFFSSLVLGFFAAVFFPYAIAGPLYRIEKELVDIGKGDLKKRIKIRKGDEVGELADSINIMVEELRIKIKKMEDISGHIDELVAQASGENVNDIIKKIKAENASLREAVNIFKL